MWHAGREETMFGIFFAAVAIFGIFGLFCAIAGAPERHGPPGWWDRLLARIEAREARRRKAKAPHDEHEDAGVG